ncbi:P-loop nucleoside triphosphate hydrolase superfamily protein with CH (Calponiny) domain-containing protein [Trifolium repens]|nr:P-loop nucleoside triphosphate hydrolase superfamily protein with CH (Calponiny) domain-containing protein [Trifolium repens]
MVNWINFISVVDVKVKCWKIRRQTKAPQAAGAIHTDFGKGFIWEVFSDTQPLIQIALDGFNVSIFAYGQTGSAKTHTISGPDNITEEKVGVNYRALRNLFCGLMNLGQKNREVDSTAMNDWSSRSHRYIRNLYGLEKKVLNVAFSGSVSKNGGLTFDEIRNDKMKVVNEKLKMIERMYNLKAYGGDY